MKPARPLRRTQEHDLPLPAATSHRLRRQDDTLDTRPLLSTLLLLTAALPAAVEGQAREVERGARDAPGIVGNVVDRVTGRPLEGAAVSLEPAREAADTLRAPSGDVDTLEAEDVDTRDAPAPVVTDASGRFIFEGIADGPYRLRIDLIGYRTVEDLVAYRAALGLRIDVQMVQTAVEIEPLLVVAEARSLHLESAGFYERRRRGLGRFVTREQMVASNALRVSDMFRTMPGVRMSGAGSSSDAGVVRLRGDCLADVYVDGVPLAPPAPIDALLAPNDVDAVEIYHASEVPPAFRTTDCGAVIIWTHTPNPGSVGDPFTWGRVLAAAAFVGLAILLTR